MLELEQIVKESERREKPPSTGHMSLEWQLVGKLV